jgi:SMP-30/Gluconolactonase/LRE-like region
VTSRDLGSGTGITRIPHDDPGRPQANWARIDDQNGLAVSPDGKWLYAGQTFTRDSLVYKIRIADPTDVTPVASLADPAFKGLDDMTIDSHGILYVAANLTGEVIRLDPASGQHCTIASGFQNTSSVKFGRGPGWPQDHLFVVGFDGVVRELTPPAGTTGGGGGGAKRKPRLALSLSPRSAVVGRSTRFRFTTYRAGGGLRANVRVRLGGKTVRTNRRGRAGLTLTFHSVGRKRAVATRSGYSRATRVVRVRHRR